MTWTIDTAAGDRYEIAKDAAAKTGIGYQTEYRSNCIKCYHIELTAEGEEQERFLQMIAAATFAHPQELERRQELSEALKEVRHERQGMDERN